MTAAALIETWRMRDSLYRKRRVGADGLTPNEETTIRWWREAEAATLPPEERIVALRDLSAWTAPVRLD